MDYFPLFMKLAGERCLLVGGGEVALRKARLLRAAGARVVVVAPELAPELADWGREGEVEHVAGRFDPAQLEGVRLVVAATDVREVNRAVSAAAQARAIPVNVVDDPELSSYITPAIVDRSPLIVAVSTGGGVPVLARLVRTRLEETIPAAYGELARFASAWRDRVKARFDSVDQRRAFWESVLEGDVAEAVVSGRAAQAEVSMAQALAAAERPHRGGVYLVGAGPGSPDLLTFRALRLMQQADVVLHDADLAPALLDLVRRDAERVAVAADEVGLERLQTLAGQGRRVLRLMAGAGRWGDAPARLAAAGLMCDAVPGVAISMD